MDFKITTRLNDGTLETNFVICLTLIEGIEDFIYENGVKQDQIVSIIVIDNE